MTRSNKMKPAVAAAAPSPQKVQQATPQKPQQPQPQQKAQPKQPPKQQPKQAQQQQKSPAAKKVSAAKDAPAPQNGTRSKRQAASVEEEASDDEDADADADDANDDGEVGEDEDEDEDDEEFDGGQDDDDDADMSDGDGEDDDAGENPLAGLLGAGGAAEMVNLFAMITAMKKQDGPIITAVHLKANGTSEEITLDMTPRADAVAKLIGGQCTFVGQYQAPFNVTIMRRKDPVPKSVPVNKHILPAPYDQDAGEFRGDFVLLRMDDTCTPCSVTLDEYASFKGATERGEPWPAATTTATKTPTTTPQKKGQKQVAAGQSAAARNAPNIIPAPSDDDAEGANGDEADESMANDATDEPTASSVSDTSFEFSPALRPRKKGMSTDEAVRYIKFKRKSMNQPEPRYGSESEEEPTTPTPKTPSPAKTPSLAKKQPAAQQQQTTPKQQPQKKQKTSKK